MTWLPLKTVCPNNKGQENTCDLSVDEQSINMFIVFWSLIFWEVNHDVSLGNLIFLHGEPRTISFRSKIFESYLGLWIEIPRPTIPTEVYSDSSREMWGITNYPTPWNRVGLEMSIISLLITKLLTLKGPRNFITVCTTVRQWTLPRVALNQQTFSYLTF